MITVILVLVLGISNPNEEAFLQKVSDTYGQFHGGLQFSPAELLEMGKSYRESYFLFSTYRYEFGSIRVNYFGAGNMVFYLGSYRKKDNETDQIRDEILV